MDKVEAIEIAFHRWLLGVRTGTPSLAIRAELASSWGIPAGGDGGEAGGRLLEPARAVG